jgi:hypothetical protein
LPIDVGGTSRKKSDCSINIYGFGSRAAAAGHTKRVAVLVPCFNEQAAVAPAVADFRKALPCAEWN